MTAVADRGDATASVPLLTPYHPPLSLADVVLASSVFALLTAAAAAAAAAAAVTAFASSMVR